MKDKPLRHTQAQRWIQARSDGVLNEAESARLDAHLQSCSACQMYAAKFLAFDAGLREQFRSRREASLGVRLPSQPRALDALDRRMRANMNNKRFSKLAGSLSFGLLMVVLGVGLTLVLSMGINPAQSGRQGTQPAVLPGSDPTATTAPSPTPLPWTDAAPLTDPEQIVAVLVSLAEKNFAAFQNGDWVYSRRQDLSEAGMIQSYYSEAWTRLPSAGETCAPFLSVVKTGPQEAQPIQIHVILPDGTSGELTNLRRGQGEVEQYGPDHLVCQITPATTAAGHLIPYLDPNSEPPLAKKPNRLIEAKAWYAELDGRLAFVVRALFEDQGEIAEENRQTYEETHHFDVLTGTLLREHIVMRWADGSLFGESQTGHRSEFLPVMPEAVIQEFERYEKELRLEAALQVALGQEAQRQEADGQETVGQEAEQIRAELEAFRRAEGILVDEAAPSDPAAAETAQDAPEFALDDLAYTRENPLTDLSAIRALLDALQERYQATLSKPGWHLYGPAQPNSQDRISNRYVLIHTLHGGCEDLIYYVKDGKILPQELHTADGRYGLIGDIENGAITDAITNWEACKPENLGIDFPANETLYLQPLQDGTVDGEVRAWVEEIDGRKYFVLNYALQFSGSQPVVMDPETRKLEPERGQHEWKYYDLEWGSRAGWAATYDLVNGKTIGSPPVEGVVPSYEGSPLEMTYYEVLPPELAEVYERTVAALEDYLNQGDPD